MGPHGKRPQHMMRPVTLSIYSASHTVQVEPDVGRLIETKGEPEEMATAAQEPLAEVDIVGELHAPALYLRQLARVVIGCAVTAAMARAG